MQRYRRRSANVRNANCTRRNQHSHHCILGSGQDVHGLESIGPFQGKLFLVVVDAHSKWLETVIVPSTSSEATIKALRPILASHGLPELVVSDNGTSFTSSEFQDFVRRNGIRHITTAPYHPATNGLAERAVQTLKEGLKKSANGDLETRLARFLFKYRTTPHSTTGVSPAELLMGRKLRSHLDLVQPDLSSRVLKRQAAQKAGHDKERTIEIDDQVYVRNFGSGPRWLPGVVTAKHGSRMFEVKLNDGRNVRRHLNQTRKRTNESSEDREIDDLPIEVLPPIDGQPAQNSPPQEQPHPRRSGRNHHPPDRYSPSSN